MDSLTMHYVARELAERCRGRRILACRADRAARTLSLWCDGATPIAFDLGALTVREASGEPRGELLQGWTIVDIEAPVDERRLVITTGRAGKFRGSLAKEGAIELSFVPNARGALVREARHALATIGVAMPPVAEPRRVLEDHEIQAAVEARDDAALLRGRWVSPTVCRALYARPERAVQLYRHIVSLPPATPVRCDGLVVPLPLWEDCAPVASLILPRVTTPAVERGEAERKTRAVARMRRELDRAREAPQLRALADALMALGDEGRAPERVQLADGTWAPVPAPDAAGQTPVAIAERLYKEARAMERALERLPGRIAALLAAPDRAGEKAPARPKRSASPRQGKRLPYKAYRSSGGIEILVGRGARANDELTYAIAKPDDVWLHARDVTGAHVVMRWAEQGAPPAKDLREAAALAAWYSRARGSVVVPVDWTRRRYVRRAKRGPPGRALVERAKTVMARPSAEMERRLRIED